MNRPLGQTTVVSAGAAPTPRSRDLPPSPPHLKKLFNVDEVRAAARRILPKPVFDFADGGAEDEQTLRRNETAFDDVTLLPRPLNGAKARDLSTCLFGHTLSMPLAIAPTGLSGLFWRDGECAAARAATAAGIPYCASHASVCTLEDIAATGASPRWMQVFVYTDRGFTRDMIERARDAGYDALVLTIDNQLLGNRERDIRNGFAIPAPLRGGRHDCGGHQGCLADAHALDLAEPHLWQLRAPWRLDRPQATGRAYGRPARPRPVLGRG